MSLADASEMPLSWMDCQTGDMPAKSISSLRGVVFEGSVIVKVGPPSSAKQLELQLTFSAVVATKPG